MNVFTIFILITLIILPSHFTKVNAEKDDKNMDSSHERIIRGYLNTYRKIRTPREPPKVIKKRDNITEVKSTINSKVVLIKKPIPKFIDMGSSEEDYQMKARNPIKYSDSVEHEDEDFNLDDYDFDIQHDEFAGRGKPLQPRLRFKPNTRRREQESVKAEERGKIPLGGNANIGKSKKVVRKAVNVIKHECNGDIPTSTKATEKVRHAVDDDSNESSDSKENEGISWVRTVRSPTSFGSYMEKLGEKTSALMSKILSHLPIFPQIQLHKN